MKDWNITINYGVKTGFNDAFIIDGAKRSELIAQDPKSAEIIRPILRGRDIKRYSYDFQNLYLINVHNGIKERNIPRINIDDYPAIKQHLDKYYPDLAKRADKGDTPYNLRNCAYMDDFSHQKIMYNDINQRLSFCLVEKDIFCNNTVYFISSNIHTKYLLACLNSKIIDWYYKTLSVQLGEKAVRMFSIYVENIPVPPIGLELESNISEIIDRIIENPSPLLINELDNYFYKIYQLSVEEQNYIEEHYKLSM